MYFKSEDMIEIKNWTESDTDSDRYILKDFD